jgi:S-adenosylmethionine hydrolase
MRRVITFLSDFGSHSPYPAAMKAVAARISEASFVDITHDVSAHNVMEGAFLLWSVARYFPEAAVHCAVVDPGVGTERRGLVLVAGGQFFVGPDNGLLVPAALGQELPRAYEITNSPFVPNAISATFHGRDLFAPVAAHLANGVPPEEIGFPISDWMRPPFDFHGGRLLESAQEFQGHVIHIDRFGNVITNLPAKLIQENVRFDQPLLLRVHAQESRVHLRRSYGFAHHHELCLILSSHELLEIAVREGRAQEVLGLHVGEPVTLRLL